MEKKRCHNFTFNEVDVLMSLVEEYKEIVECKKTDTVTNSVKEAEWRKIEIKFNAACGTGRTAKMLRSKWDSLKKSIKKEYAEHKQNLYKTGGGPAVDVKLSGVGNRVLAIIGVGATGTLSQLDSDFDTSYEPVRVPVIEESASDTVNVDENIEAIDSNSTMKIVEVCPDKVFTSTNGGFNLEISEMPSCSWNSWTPHQLRQPKSNVLQVLKVAEDTCDASYMDPLTIEKKESANCTPAKCDTPRGLVDSGKRKRFYKTESIPSKIRKHQSKDMYEELARKKIEFIDFQMALLKEEAERKEKRLAEKHELEIKILLTELQEKNNKI